MIGMMECTQFKLWIAKQNLLRNISLGWTSAEIGSVSGVRRYSRALTAVGLDKETLSISLTCELQKWVF